MSYRSQIFLCVIFLVFFGITIIFASSAVMAGDRFGSLFFFAKKQLFAASIGLTLIGILQIVPLKLLEKLNLLILFTSVTLLILVLIPGIGYKVKGAYRWLRVSGINLQPSEIAKFSILLFLAKNLGRSSFNIKSFWYGVFPNVLVSLLLAGLIILQPDLGSAFIILSLCFVLLFISGIPKWQVGVALSTGLAALAFAVYKAPYRLARLISFLNPWEYRSSSGFQIIQSFMAFKNGGMLGQGLGESKQKLFFLPEAQTDFIFPVIAEELGLLGAIFVICVFVYLCLLGFRVSHLHKNTPYLRLLAFGVSILIALQTIINIGVSTGSLPTKGISLPFISSGGSSLMIFMVLAGLLMKLAHMKKRENT